MRRQSWAPLGAAILFLPACAGVSITPIDQTKAADAHRAGGDVKGYIVYAPVVVVEVSAKTVCIKQKQDKCEDYAVVCAAGTPFTLPDYTKPYVVEVKSGLGKAGVDIALKDGWLISHIKDSSDNTAILGMVEKLIGLDKKSVDPKASGACSVAGLYRVKLDGQGIKLDALQLYK